MALEDRYEAFLPIAGQRPSGTWTNLQVTSSNNTAFVKAADESQKHWTLVTGCLEQTNSR
jgi:hypothetical protein